jgi:hypothetical protein
MALGRAGVALGLLAALVLGELWFLYGQDHGGGYVVQRAQDMFDRRPARRILLVGNSRTYYHGMPAMLREIADSAASPTKFQIDMDAQGGASFQSLWQEPRTQALLQDRWDDVIFQGESWAQSGDDTIGNFLAYGEKLLRAAHPASGPPRLVVNWDYDPQAYSGNGAEEARDDRRHHIREDSEILARRTGARLIDVERLWEQVRQARPGIQLTEDGNHPTIAGSYLFALALYAALSGSQVGDVTYVPNGMSPGDAALLRQAVDEAGLAILA